MTSMDNLRALLEPFIHHDVHGIGSAGLGYEMTSSPAIMVELRPFCGVKMTIGLVLPDEMADDAWRGLWHQRWLDGLTAFQKLNGTARPIMVS